MTTLVETVPPQPVIRSITAEDVYAALSEGWQDFRAVPRFGLFFGGVYALVGIALLLTLWAVERPALILPLAVAFPLVGPFVAVGLYEVSRRREAGSGSTGPRCSARSGASATARFRRWPSSFSAAFSCGCGPRRCW